MPHSVIPMVIAVRLARFVVFLSDVTPCRSRVVSTLTRAKCRLAIALYDLALKKS